MSLKDNKNGSSLVEAYNLMILRVKNSIDSAEAHTVPTLQKAIEQARKKAIHLGEVSLEEAEEVGNYIKRDINDAAEYLMETSHEFSEWLMLDLDLIEQKVLELFLSVADKTHLELEQLARPSCSTAIKEYRSGKITGPGSLVCVKCRQIPQCEKCASKLKLFKRADK